MENSVQNDQSGSRNGQEESLSAMLSRIIKNDERIIKEIDLCLARFRENAAEAQKINAIPVREA